MAQNVGQLPLVSDPWPSELRSIEFRVTCASVGGQQTACQSQPLGRSATAIRTYGSHDPCAFSMYFLLIHQPRVVVAAQMSGGGCSRVSGAMEPGRCPRLRRPDRSWPDSEYNSELDRRSALSWRLGPLNALTCDPGLRRRFWPVRIVGRSYPPSRDLPFPMAGPAPARVRAPSRAASRMSMRVANPRSSRSPKR